MTSDHFDLSFSFLSTFHSTPCSPLSPSSTSPSRPPRVHPSLVLLAFHPRRLVRRFSIPPLLRWSSSLPNRRSPETGGRDPFPPKTRKYSSVCLVDERAQAKLSSLLSCSSSQTSRAHILLPPRSIPSSGRCNDSRSSLFHLRTRLNPSSTILRRLPSSRPTSSLPSAGQVEQRGRGDVRLLDPFAALSSPTFKV